MTNSKQISNFSEYLEYDTSSSTCLRWKKSIGKAVVGAEAGKFEYRPNGLKSAIRVGLGGKLYQAHRIIYEMLIGIIPENMVIDHLDGNPFNNHISNLKLKTGADNSRNLKLNVNNVSGHAGISLRYSNNFKNLNYQASFVDEFGIRRSKNFSHLKYGKEKALEMAVQWRNENIARLKSLGFQYTDRNKGEK